MGHECHGKEKKGFFSKMIDKLDKKIEEQSKKSCCCKSKDKDSKDKKCCG